MSNETETGSAEEQLVRDNLTGDKKKSKERAVSHLSALSLLLSRICLKKPKCCALSKYCFRLCKDTVFKLNRRFSLQHNMRFFMVVKFHAAVNFFE